MLELHSGWGAVVVHDGLLPAGGHGRAPSATVEGVFPAELRAKVLAAEAESADGASSNASH
jgi:4-hydroxy-3-polyprenylbenzoate decarboxylase